ncbi:MAG: MHS family MFS transporter [Actinomycetota bacterium]|nr:MHS family MFS transporter [Actinomycetota bacterium]
MEKLGGESVGQEVSPGKVALASAIGATIEWYDFFIFGTAAGLIFNQLFFTSLDPITGTLVAYLTFAVGFVARPVGSVIFGHYGDRIGRKTMLILTLFMVGAATFLIGLLPTYSSIGIWAPILLVVLRIAQGIGIGGEYGGAVLMAVEYAPEGRRGFYGSWPQVGVPAGLLLGTGAFGLISLLPDEQFFAWGWRAVFLASIVLVAIGLYIRLQILETPAFTRLREAQEEAQVPFMELLRAQPKELLLGMGTRWIEGLVFNAYGVFVISYATSQLELARTTVLIGVAVASAFGVVLVPVYGLLSDRFGRRVIYGAGVALFGLFAFPSFLLINTRQPILLWLSIVVALGLIYPAIYAPLAAFWSELFDTRVRYTGIGAVYQFSGILASGLTPTIATALLGYAGGEPWLFVGYMIVVTLISLTAAYFSPETYHRDIIRTPSAVKEPQMAAES